MILVTLTWRQLKINVMNINRQVISGWTFGERVYVMNFFRFRFRNFTDGRDVEDFNDFVEGDDLVLVRQLIDRNELVTVRDIALKNQKIRLQGGNSQNF